MTLEKQYTSVGLTGGIDTSTDPKQVEPPRMLTVDNAMYVTEKMLRKRYGYTVVPNTPTPARTVASDGRGLLVTAANTLYAQDVASGSFNVVGSVPTAQIAQTSVYTSEVPQFDSVSYDVPSIPGGAQWLYLDATNAVVAWHERGQNQAQQRVYWGILDTLTNRWTTPPTALQAGGSFGTVAFPCDPRLFYDAASNYFYIFYMAHVVTTSVPSGQGSVELRYQVFFGNQPSAGAGTEYTLAPIYPATATQGLVTATGYDVIKFAGAVYVAYTRTASTNNYVLLSCSSGFGGQLNPAVAAPASTTAGGGSIKICLAANNTYLAVVLANGFVGMYDTSGNALSFVTGSFLAGTVSNAPVSALFDSNGSVANLYVVQSGTRPQLTADNPLANPPTTISSGYAPFIAQIAFTGPASSFTRTTYSPTTFPFVSGVPILYAAPALIAGVLYFWYGTTGLLTTRQPVAFFGQLDTGTGAFTWLARQLYLEAGELVNGATDWPCAARCVANVSGTTVTTFMPQVVETLPTSGIGWSGGRGKLLNVSANVSPATDVQPIQVPEGILYPGPFAQVYDGVTVLEAGFTIAPELTVGTTTGTFTAGLLYSFVGVWVRYDTKGNAYRSAPGPIVTVGTTASTAPQIINVNNAMAYDNAVLEIYQTTSTQASTYYLLGTCSGRHSVAVNRDDTSLVTHATRILYTSGTANQELANDPMPAVTFTCTTKQRMFGVSAADPTVLYFSKPFRAGHPTEWSESFTIQTAQGTGPITALAALDDRIVVFKADAIYLLSGDGPDATGNGTFNPLEQIPSDLGCTDPGSVVVGVAGAYFKGRRGIACVTRSFTLQPVGQSVNTYTETVVSATMVPALQHIRFMTASGKTLVYDYLANRWSTFSSQPARCSVAVSGVLYYIDTTGNLRQEVPGTFTDDGAAIQMTIETPWLKMAGAQGWGRLYRLAVLGDFKSTHTMTVSLAYDYASTYTDSVPFTTSSGLINGDSVYQFRMSRVPRQIMQAVKLRLQDSSTTGESCDISTITLEVGQKAGVAKLPSQKTV